MPASSPFPVVVQNIWQPGSSKVNVAIVNKALIAGRGGIVLLNETSESVVKRHLVALRDSGDLGGWDVSQHNELAICWTRSRFERVDSGYARVMRGGFRGAGKSKLDKRRRGPDRYVLWVVLKDRETNRMLLAWTHHAIAKYTSTAKWRAPLAAAAFKAVAAELAQVLTEHPSALLMGGGDFNGPHPAFPFEGHVWSASPASYPAKRPSKKYDWFGHDKAIQMKRMTTLRTASDHLGLVATCDLATKENPVPTSQNGWSVYTTSTSLTPLAWITGRTRGGDVHALLEHLCRRFNAEVERIDAASSWGWAYRAIRGQSSGYSNHASGTAIDLNAPKHPLGKRGTFSTAQKAAIHRILEDFDGAIRWGGDYSGRPDEMHFEVNTTAAKVAAVAARINRTTDQEDDMTPDQAKTLDRAFDAANRAVVRGNVNTRLILRVADQLGVKIDDLTAEVKALDAADEKAGA